MNAKMGFRKIHILILSTLMAACGEQQSPNLTLIANSTTPPKPLPSATSTLTPTSAPSRSPTPSPLQCQIAKTEGQKEAEAYAFNIYALIIEEFPSPSASASVEIEVVQVDISGESGQVDREQAITQELGPDWTTMIVTINDTRTYTQSKNGYKFYGFIIYDMVQFGRISEYSITVSGGIFALRVRSCSGKF